MEKLIYVLWKERAEDDASFNRRLLEPVAESLARQGATRLQLNVVDQAVAAAAHLRAEPIRPAPAAMVSFWLGSAHARQPCEALLEANVGRIAGYAVAEATVLPNSQSPGADFRVRGFSQLAFFSKLPGITQEGFLEIWMRDQTRVGPETQETFYYAQNIVTRVLTPGAPPWHGIVEECYPPEAMTDHLVYWKAGGSEAVYQEHYAREMANVSRFIDLDRIAVIATSAYRIGGWVDQPV